MSNVYVFALVERPPAASARTMRIARHRIEFMPLRGIYAAVERRRTQPRISEASLRGQHDVVVKLARKCEAILPVRFGALVDEGELERMVNAREELLGAALETVRNREQMTVRLFTDDERRIAPPPAGTSGTAYLKARRAAATPKLTRLASSIRRAVAPLAAQERLDAGRGRMQLAMHHLVDRGLSGDYEARVARVVSRSRASDTVVVSGPWPPFAFAPELLP
jgi:hypothetical protein